MPINPLQLRRMAVWFCFSPTSTETKPGPNELIVDGGALGRRTNLDALEGSVEHGHMLLPYQ